MTAAVNIGNFPATQAISGNVGVSQVGAFVVGVDNNVQIISSTGGDVFKYTQAEGPTSDIVGASRSTTGTLVTIPATRTFNGSVTLSWANSNAAGANVPTISISGTGALPSGTIHQVQGAGLAAIVSSGSSTSNFVNIYGGSAGATVTFTVGATGTSSGTISGRLLAINV